MAFNISLKPEVGNTFKRLKQAMDKYVYDTKTGSLPNFYEIEMSGAGAGAGEDIQIYRNNKKVLDVKASSGGDFEVPVPITYKDSNSFCAKGSSSGTSNIIAFNVYNWLLFHYLYSQEFLRIIQSLAQSKQDLYIDTKVGDSVEPILESEKDSYDSTSVSLKDKFTLPIPSDYWGQDIKNAVKKAIEVSEKGPVHASIQALKDCYAGVSLEKIFVYSMENPIYWNLDTDHIPIAKGPLNRDTLVIPEYTKIRVGWKYMYVTMGQKEKIFSTTPATGSYYWVYVDGEKDLDDTLTVKVTSYQPTPGLYSKTLTFSEIEVSTDDSEGTITGIAYQKYVTLSPPVASITSSVSIDDDNGVYSSYNLISREILALGQANTKGILTVTYQYYLDASILCVVYVDGTNTIQDVMRIWALPGHIRPQTDEDSETLQIYFKFSSVPSNYKEVLSNIRDILMEIVPITLSFEPWINLAKDDQDIIPEDSFYWPELEKGYCLLSDIVSSPERYRDYQKIL